MPFMIGSAPIRRTLGYLKSGKIVLRETVKIFSIHYSVGPENHKGIRDFVFWHLDQIQYKNPGVQCLTIKNVMPSPFIRIFFDDASDVIINVNCREKGDIMNHLLNFTAVCKSQDEIFEDSKESLKHDKSLFGHGCARHCMCEIMGQVPCPAIVNLPYIWRNLRKTKSKKFNVPYYYTEKGLVELDDE